VASPFLRAFRHRNYRLFFGGQLISLIGTWMQSVAESWLVFRLTGSSALLGVSSFASLAPVFLFATLGGTIADRAKRHRIIVTTQTVSMILPLTLSALTFTHTVRVWHVFVLAACLGVVNAFDIPARQAFLVEMVGREDLMNAIALNSSVFNGAAVIGPSVAGVLIGFLGVKFCFLINSLSFLGPIAGLLLMSNLPRLVRDEESAASVWERIREGAAYARHDRLVGTLLLTVGVFSMFAMNRLTLIPLFAEKVLHVGATGFGFLMAALGLGALTGALSLVAIPRVNGRRQFWFGVAWAVMLLLFSSSRNFWLSLAALYGAGVCQMLFVATANTRIQLVTPDHLRGRVMALYAQAVMGVGPIGSTQAGALSALLGPPAAMAIGAVIAGATVVGVRIWRPAAFLAEGRNQPT